MTNPSTHPEPVALALLDGYLAGTATADERAAVEAWLVADSAHVQVLGELRAVMPIGATKVDRGREWDVLRVRLERESGWGGYSLRGMSVLGKQSRRSGPFSKQTLRVGMWCSATLAACIALVGIRQYLRPATVLPIARTYATGTAEQRELTLLDGTRVRLAPGSRLDLTGDFGRATRAVTLTGEAYFDVMHTAGALFVVHTGNVATRVFGTRFTVRQYNHRDPVCIAVISGKVSTGGRSHPVTLTPGMAGAITDSTATVSRTGDITAYTGWITGQMVFEDVPASVVLTTIGRWYGYTFRVTDSLTARLHISATFKISAPAAALEGLKRVLDVTMTFEGNVVTLRPNVQSPSRDADRRRVREVYSTSTEIGR